jgi:hypothetical protein
MPLLRECVAPPHWPYGNRKGRWNSTTVCNSLRDGTRLALPAHGVVRGSSPSVRCLPIGLALPAAIPLVAAGYFFEAESRLLTADRSLLH